MSDVLNYLFWVQEASTTTLSVQGFLCLIGSDACLFRDKLK
jgi:hypothetical protein